MTRRLHPARPAPDADEHVDRDQHRLEEDVEEDQVLRREDADERADEEEHQAEVGAGAIAVGPGAVADRARADDDGQADEPELEAVETDGVRDPELLEPLLARGVLLHVAPEVEVPRAPEPEPDLGERDEEREARGRLAGDRRDPDEQRADERDDDEQRGQHQRTTRKTRARTATEIVIARAYVRRRPLCAADVAAAPRSVPSATSSRPPWTTGPSKRSRSATAIACAGREKTAS